MASSVALRSSLMSLNSPYSTANNEDLKKYALKLLEQLETFVNEDTIDQKYSYRLIAKVCHYLKTEGSRLDEDSAFKQQLDVYFNLLRNILRKPNLSPLARAMILQVIELRASNWIHNEDIDAYYRQKTAEFEANDSYSADISPEMATQSAHGTDLVKTSKSAKPTKMQGKTYLRDEVLIRNGDSGKVAAGAKERIVQITGQTEENIERAKELIETTIKRNASPVPFECPNKPFEAKLSQSPVEVTLENDLFDSNIGIDAQTQTQRGHSFVVTINGDVIELSTTNFDLGLKAQKLLKQLLGEHIGHILRQPLEQPSTQSIRHPIKEAAVPLVQPLQAKPAETLRRPSLQSMEKMLPKDLSPINEPQENGFTLIEQTVPELKVKPIEPTLHQIQKSSSQGMLPIGRTSLRFLSAQTEPQTSSEQKPKITYNRNFLMECAQSPSSVVMSNVDVMAKIYTKTPDIIRKHRNSGQNPNSSGLIKSNSFTQRPQIERWD